LTGETAEVIGQTTIITDITAQYPWGNMNRQHICPVIDMATPKQHINNDQ